MGTTGRGVKREEERVEEEVVEEEVVEEEDGWWRMRTRG